MEIGPIQGAALQPQTGSTAGKASAGFADMLTKALGQLQSVSDTANQKVNALATGQDIELQDVMLALESESLSMNLATTVRNKAVEAYQEIFRMNF
jgi:flagellar hook-basal body complex protein FliE